MLEQIYVNLITHPEVYAHNDKLCLDADFTGNRIGDCISVDRSRGYITRFPITGPDSIIYLRKEDPIWGTLPPVNCKPTNNDEMTAFLETLDICERTDIHGALMRRGWAKTDQEAGQLMNDCGMYLPTLWKITASSDDGWEPGIT